MSHRWSLTGGLALLVVVSTASAAQANSAADTVEVRRPIRVCAGGDMMLGSNLDPAWLANGAATLRQRFGRSADPDSLLAPLRPLFADADVALLNVEGAIGDGRAPSKCGPRSTSCFAFRQPPAAAGAYRRIASDSAVVVGNVANNHSRDAGVLGFRETRRHLEAAGVFVAGADTVPAIVPLPWGDTIAVLGFHTSAEAPDARDLAAVRRHVARAAARHDIVVVAVHIGGEGAGAQRTRDLTEVFLGASRGNPVAFARTAFGAGATLVVGHGPHVLRAAEWTGDRLAFYSLGNLVTYGPFRNTEPLNRGAVACALIGGPGHVLEAQLRPTVQRVPGVVEWDSTGRAWGLVDSLTALDFPSTGALVLPTGVLGRRPRP